jgi:hypothetical protein
MFDKTGTLFTKIDQIENYQRVKKGHIVLIDQPPTEALTQDK